VNGHRPSADVLFHSVAQEFGLTSVGIIMTGMGDDGAEGLGVIKAAGGMTIAQSEDTCVVGGMPRAAIVKGYANKIVPLDGLGAYPRQQLWRGTRLRKKTRRAKKLTRTTSTKGPPFLLRAREGECGDKEKAMKQFAALLRKTISRFATSWWTIPSSLARTSSK